MVLHTMTQLLHIVRIRREYGRNTRLVYKNLMTTSQTAETPDTLVRSLRHLRRDHSQRHEIAHSKESRFKVNRHHNARGVVAFHTDSLRLRKYQPACTAECVMFGPARKRNGSVMTEAGRVVPVVYTSQGTGGTANSAERAVIRSDELVVGRKTPHAPVEEAYGATSWQQTTGTPHDARLRFSTKLVRHLE